ncbi:MAG: homoserine kinase [Candidatus Caenarcaniphilales bacterium]|nr:homoserine kinase [Candidatus Caenarcaniphilales bacterium]
MSASNFSIKVPASTSNLGPGFDTIGLALDLYNTYSFESIGNTGELIYQSNLAQIEVPYTKDNLVYRAFDYVFKKESKSTPGVKIFFEAGIPTTGGFGSSSTAILAGLMAANRILNYPYDREKLLRIGTQLDGHPDNITPAFVGGLVVCVYANQVLDYIKLPWDQNLFFVVVTPDFKVPTAKARAVLPAQIEFADAIYNVGYSSLLIAALAAKDTNTVKKCFKDRLHQHYRAKLVPGMQYVLDVGVEAGAIGTMLSGAGSALIAVVDNDQVAQTVGMAMQSAWMQSDVKADFRIIRAIENGASYIE